MTLTDELRADLQNDLGIGTDESVFTNAELARLYVRADSDYDQTMILALRQLLIQAARLHRYTLAQSSSDHQQVFANLKVLLAIYEQQKSGGTQVKMIGLTAVPPRSKDKP